ncbi:MAG TPA: hypothetical protein VIK61_10340, partial [Acidimicrobiia bacterium]
MTTSTSCARRAPGPRARRARGLTRFAALAAALSVLALTTSTPSLGASTRSVPKTVARAPATTVTSVATPTITLAHEPAWVAPGSDFSLGVRLTGPVAHLILRVTVHPAITSRTGFSDTLAGRGDNRVVDDVSVAVAFLPRTRTGEYTVPIGLQDPDSKRDFRRVSVHSSGVYPITVSLSPQNADPVTKIDTWLVVAQQPIESPLSFAWVWQLVGTPLTSTNQAEVQATVGPDGRLG